jgi:hypothetical protein
MTCKNTLPLRHQPGCFRDETEQAPQPGDQIAVKLSRLVDELPPISRAAPASVLRRGALYLGLAFIFRA